MKKISCIIPAFNEAERISKIMELAAANPLIYEVIVVDDGSSDGTREVITKNNLVKPLFLPKNLGKSGAVHAGIEAASGEYILLLDADLIGLTDADISSLIQPILDDRADVTISLRQYTAPIHYLLGIDYISGERVFPKRMLENESEKLLSLPKFGLEVFLNNLIIAHKYRVKVVRWKSVWSTLKWKKQGFLRGTIGEIRMRLDIYQTIGIGSIVSQIRKLRNLMVK